MTPTCPECGAAHSSSCKEIFDEFLVLEFTDPGYGAVHFLTVACYMVQHNGYSDLGLAWIAEKLRAHLEQGVPVEQIRDQANQDADQSRRGWKVNRQPGEPPLPRIPWSMTIAAVAASYHDAASYRERITQWARVTLREMQPLLNHTTTPEKPQRTRRKP